ncbi:MAG: iron ABC transporter permease [Bacteroidota bacterium]
MSQASLSVLLDRPAPTGDGAASSLAGVSDRDESAAPDLSGPAEADAGTTEAASPTNSSVAQEAVPEVSRGRSVSGRALAALAVALAVSLVLSLGIGAVGIAPGAVLAILADRVGLGQLGLALPWDYTGQQALVLTGIRLPRVLLGVLVGAALAVSGALMQGLFRNPLADPGLIGVSSGAALGASTMIVLGGSVLSGVAAVLGFFGVAFGAFAGGLAVTVLVYRIATRGRRTDVATMLLAGIALNALCGAGTGALVLFSDEGQLRSLTFWTLGSLGGATWPTVLAVIPFVVVLLAAAPRLARALNAMLLGESEARHLGVRVDLVKRLVIGLAALAVGAVTAVSGLIGFVGLVVPHLVRLALGPDHRTLLPASALLGATLLVVTDTLARVVIEPAEVPIGILTALGGAPFFLALLLHRRRDYAL